MSAPQVEIPPSPVTLASGDRRPRQTLVAKALGGIPLRRLKDTGAVAIVSSETVDLGVSIDPSIYDKRTRKVQALPDGTYLKFRAWNGRVNFDDGLKQGQERLDHAERLHAELRDKYGIAMPGIRTRVGTDPEGNRGYFTRSEGVVGSMLVDVARYIPTDKLEGLYCSLVRYYRDKAVRGGEYLTDMDNAQFMYGTLNGHEGSEPEIYLIDQEPIYTDGQSAGVTQAHAWASVRLEKMISEMEQRRGAPLQESQRALEQLQVGTNFPVD